jgi:hypothetical protein
MILCVSLAKQVATTVTHHTIAQANWIFHRRMRPEAPLAMPRMADITATKSY